MNELQLKARARELRDEIVKATKACEDGRLETKRFNGIVDKAYEESETILKTLENLQRGKQAYAAAEAFEMGQGTFDPPTNDGSDPAEEWLNPRWIEPTSPSDITREQMKALWNAFANKQAVSIEIKQKHLGGRLSDWKSGVSTKSAVTETGITASITGNLPPVQTPYAVGLGYETTRASSLLPGAAMPGPSATYLVHTGNASATTGVAEGGTKGDIGAEFANYQVTPQKIAGLASMTLEAWQDTESYGEARFSGWLPQELTRDLINTESLWVLQATTAGSNSIDGGPVNSTFNGLLNTSGTLTREVGDDSPLDALSLAFNDIRVGSAFAWPDLTVMHPTTWNAIRRSKDSEGRYILGLLDGPLSLTADGSPAVNTPPGEPNPYSIIKQGAPALAGNLWGCPIAISTQVSTGTAIVMSVRAGGGIFWQRLGMRIEFNPWGDAEWTTNKYSWRAEERVSLSVPRPSALNIVTGLPTS